MRFLRSAVRLTAVAGVGLALSGISGCETSGADAILAAQDYYDALIGNDGTAACAVLTAPARAVLVASLHESCEQAVLAIAPPREFLHGLKVNDAHVQRTEATVEVIPLGKTATGAYATRLSFDGGAWRVADPYSPTGPPTTAPVVRPGAS